MARIKARQAARPLRHPAADDECEQPVILGLQSWRRLLRDGDRTATSAQPRFRQAVDFYVGLFRDGLAPGVATRQVANLYQQFAAGDFAMYITGPWNVGEFRRRLPPEMQDKWATAPLPAPDGARAWPGVSVAGGASLVLFRASRHPEAAWKLVEFLSEPAQQVALLRAHRRPAGAARAPGVIPAWLGGRPRPRAFRAQLEHVAPAPKVPEWEQIAIQIWQSLEPAIRGRESRRRRPRRSRRARWTASSRSGAGCWRGRRAHAR